MKRVFGASVFSVVLAGLSVTAQAQDYAGVNCRDITDNMERLACYDAQAGAQEVTPPAAPVAPVVPAPAPMSDLEKFGLKESRKTERTEDEFGSQNLRKEQRAARRAERAANRDARIAQKEARKAAKEAERAAELNAIETRLTKFRTLADGRMRFTLSNGQVWEQVTAQKMRLKPGPSPDVTIERAALGSFRLKVAGVAGAFKVRRVE